MNREIKFRGKTRTDGGWVYGLPDYNSSGAIGTINGWLGEDGFETYQSIEVIDETVTQFTGLCDKNGTGIYEGDILKMSMYGNVIIVWNEKVSAFQYAYKAIGGGTSVGGRMTNTLHDHLLKMYEIIGNVFENTELLK